MIAADSSTLIDYLKKVRRADCDLLGKALERDMLVLSPPVVSEVMSNMASAKQFEEIEASLKILEILDGFWHRAGVLREKIIRQGKKAKLGDALIAQVCIDHDVPLITADMDFENFAPLGLKLAK